MNRENGVILEEKLNQFEAYLLERENSPATIRKYMTDVRTFFSFCNGFSELNKDILLNYKEWLNENYAISSANSMIAALNQYLESIDRGKWKLKRFKIQRQMFRDENRNLNKIEYERLKKAALESGQDQLALIIETICSTGIRVSELAYFQVKFIKSGRIQIRNKGKIRTILIPRRLQIKLLYYIKKNHITAGPIFVTRDGNPHNRSNIWKKMKKLSVMAKVDRNKVFPHNLRHLFARIFYIKTKDIAGLADILGHSDMNTTRIYTKNDSEYYQRQIETLDLVSITI